MRPYLKNVYKWLEIKLDLLLHLKWLLWLKDYQNQDQEKDEEKEGDEQKDGQGNEEKKEEEKQQQSQPKSQEKNMSPEELARILQALQNDEKDTQEKVNLQKATPVKIKVEKDWWRSSPLARPWARGEGI